MAGLWDDVTNKIDEVWLMWSGPSGDWTAPRKEAFVRALRELAANPSFGLSFAASQGLDKAMTELLSTAWGAGSMALTVLTFAAGKLFTAPIGGVLLNTTQTLHENCKTATLADELAGCKQGFIDFKPIPMLGLDRLQTFYLGCILELRTFTVASSLRPQLARFR